MGESAVTSDTASTNASCETETSQQALERKQLALESRKLQCENVADRLVGFGIDSSLLLALPSALIPFSAERSPFQEKVLDQFEKEAQRVMRELEQRESK